MAAAYLRRTEDRLSKWGFPSSTALIVQAANAAEVATSDKELVDILDAVNVYLNRLGGWVDAMIPWNDMDQSLKLLQT